TAMDGCFSLRAAWMPLEDDSSVILTSIHSVRKIRFPAPLLKIPYTLPSTFPSCLPVPPPTNPSLKLSVFGQYAQKNKKSHQKTWVNRFGQEKVIHN
ncbi:MAG: hypothetical protein J6K58_15120, partial [Lachnospiraceae bacterium]|nr:hypothetical protein [Lachnospiraceae bacterium]